jgi:hypothetical protein
MEYDNTNRGALFKELDKQSDKHPDYTGKINVDGKELRLAAWIKDGKSGKFMSLSVSEFKAPQPGSNYQKPEEDDDFDIVPF